MNTDLIENFITSKGREDISYFQAGINVKRYFYKIVLLLVKCVLNYLIGIGTIGTN